MDLQDILALPGSGRRFHRPGIDSLQLVQHHVAAAWEDPAGRCASGVMRRKSRDRLLQLLDRALAWLGSAQAEGLLNDCSDADIAAAEEEWLCLETELQLEEQLTATSALGRG